MNDLALSPAAPAPAACDWPVTNCYIDAWWQVLQAWGLQPLAALGVTVTQDYEGDQFTFFKYLHEDLERLFGLLVGELAIFTSVEEQTRQQVSRGNLVLVEVDGFYLPDTRATSYRAQHTKTTIGVDSIAPAAGRLTYFHNAGHYTLDDEDYAGVFRKLPHQQGVDDALPPYVEFVRRRWPALQGRALTDEAVALLRRHLRRRPDSNPIVAYRADFARDMEWLQAHPDRFHDYAFVTFRQLGANFQLLSQHLQWLQAPRVGAFGGADLAPVIEATAGISSTSKAMQFKVARIVSRRRFDPCDAMFDALEQGYQAVMRGLDAAFA